MSIKNTIFISHAQPEDNYFCSWIASKLRLLGYNVWLELDDLNSGSTFNAKVESVIRNEACLCLAVVSNAYINKLKIAYSGVSNEANLMLQLARGQEDFIIPFQISDFAVYNLPMQFAGIDTINFNDNWATGLEKLIKFLNKKNIQKVDKTDIILEEWYKSIKHKSTVKEREERYYTNWFPIYFPEKIYIHKPNVLDWKETYKIPYTFLRCKDRIIGFFSEEECKKYIDVFSSDTYEIQSFFSNFDLDLSETEDKLKLPNKLLVNLVNKIFRNFLHSKNLSKYELSSKKEAFYFDSLPEESNRVSLKKYKKTNRTINGISNEYKWFFAISGFANLYPFPHILISSHLYFTKKNGELINDPDMMQSLRRSVPSGWYNRKWFETLLAMSLKVSEDNDFWEINVGSSNLFKIASLPYEVVSPLGYIEPQNAE
ncbi:toll/interleukin-1 receptor domain-containing protein [Runella sp. MFBS21]|uniref:toll/interleukin-1 receptor domain-containing protein n=1 Tax=Runella sp. MFBS21 TaxID=3034018 RepID=UPI0023F88888|nr:toll/interleukin-1 receptor domain-containing protein [Runella sp. MFBS21]MDF7819856.1 toll/interleukin-1 receptor domain-containing protein [Runella sp. MFBS21]